MDGNRVNKSQDLGSGTTCDQGVRPPVVEEKYWVAGLETSIWRPTSGGQNLGQKGRTELGRTQQVPWHALQEDSLKGCTEKCAVCLEGQKPQRT